MNILVTGGAGYIGSHAVAQLIQAGHKVVVYDSLQLGHREAVRDATLVEGDLRETTKLTQTLRDNQVELVMHFAALAEVGQSVAQPHLYYQTNVVGALSLLEAMRAVEVKQFVFSSTTATYGAPETIPIPETTPQQPINPYGFTKLVIERALSDYAAAYDFGYAALRYFNAAGAHPSGELGEDHTPESHLIPIVLQVAMGQREKITIFGDDYPTPDGTCIRDYIHVEDLADAHLRAMTRLEPGKGLCVNLGTGRGTSVMEIVQACREVTGHEIPVELGERRPGDPPELVADPSLAKKLLEWTPKYLDTRETIQTAWNWHQAHPHGYKT